MIHEARDVKYFVVVVPVGVHEDRCVRRGKFPRG